MHLFARWFAMPIVILALSACGGQDPDPSTSSAPLPDKADPAPRSTPAETPPGPAERSSAASGSGPDRDGLQQARAERERMRQRLPRERMQWDEAAMRDRLGLNADQFQALHQAHQTLLQERVTVRTGLQAQRHFRAQAEAAADTAQLEQIEARSRQLRAQLETAEQTWQDALHSILDADQLQRWPEQP